MNRGDGQFVEGDEKIEEYPEDFHHLSDVECWGRECVANLREELANKCKAIWLKETIGAEDKVLPLPTPTHLAKGPHELTGKDMRAALLAAQ